MLEQKINEFFGDDEPSGFGTGWWSGVLSAFFGVLAFGAVVCLHFPQLLSSPELRISLPDEPHADADPGRDRGSDHPRRHLRDAAPEEGPGFHRDAVRARCDPVGRRQRRDQRAAARRPGNRPRLVPARHAADDADLLADRGAVAGLSEAERLPARVAAGRGVLPLHASTDPDHDVPDPVACHSTHASAGQRRPAASDGQPALAGAVLPGRAGGGPRRVRHPPSAPRSAVAVALPCHPPFLQGARLDRRLARSPRGRPHHPRLDAHPDDVHRSPRASSRRTCCSSRSTPPGRTRTSARASSGSSPGWCCRGSTTGITRRRRKPSTRTTRSTSRGSTSSSGPTTSRRKAGRRRTACTTRRYQQASGARPSTRSRAGSAARVRTRESSAGRPWAR